MRVLRYYTLISIYIFSLWIPVYKKQKQITISIKAAIVIGVIIVVGALAYRYKGLLVAATVNGSPISRFSVIEELEKKSGKATLDALIIQKLIADRKST